MLATKIACPHCSAALKTNQPLPVGKKVKCPKCGTPFVVGGDPSSAAITRPPAVPVPPPVPRGGVERAPASSPPALPANYRADVAPPSGTNGKVVALVAGGLLLLLGASVGLAIYCFSGDNNTSTDEAPQVEKKSRDTVVAEKPAPKPVAPIVPVAPAEQRLNQKPSVVPRPAEEAARTLTREYQDKVNKAVDRGVAYLKSTQQADGTWATPKGRLNFFQVGFTALPGLTLLECGVKKSDPAIQKVAAFLRAQEAATSFRKIQLTYDLSLAILFLDRLGDPQDRELIRKLALRLVAGQTISGGWTYRCPVLSDSEHERLASLLQKSRDPRAAPLSLKPVDPSKLSNGGADEVPEKLKSLTVWRDDTVANPANRGTESDNSNTQFAILGLWAAKRYDLPLQRTLALIVKRFHKSQNEDGSWGYLANGREMVVDVKHPTMTCAGLLGLAVGLGLESEARSTEGRKPAAQDPRVKPALELLARSVGDPNKPWQKVPHIDLYFIWSVERVAVIFNLPRIGGKDWYGWGAEMLVGSQTDKGCWENGQYSHSTPTIDTCFALLFLKRANLAKDLTSKLQLID